MQRLQLAQQGFESLSPDLHTALDETISDRVEAWLHDDVCRVVEELIDNRNFQSHTRWSAVHLTRGAQTPARRALERVDHSLISLARELHAALENVIDTEAHGSVDPLSGDRDSLSWITTRPWFDLVSLEDFFQPMRGLHWDSQLPEHAALRRRHHEAFVRTELRIPLGDYLARTMFARVDYWSTLLDRCTSNVLCYCSVDSGPEPTLSDRLLTRKTEMEQSILALQGACDHPVSTRLRDACASLTLAYVAYAVSPQCDWLGFPSSWAGTFAPHIRTCIRRPVIDEQAGLRSNRRAAMSDSRPISVCDPHTVRQIALALDDITPLYEMPEDPDDLIDSVKDTARLLLVDRSPRQVYWEGQPIADSEWDSSETQWNLLWTLAHSPGRMVDQQMLKNPDGQKMASRRNRLKRLLVKSPMLNAQISTHRRQGYRLDLEPQHVILLQDDGDGRLQFVSSHHLRNR